MIAEGKNIRIETDLSRAFRALGKCEPAVPGLHAHCGKCDECCTTRRWLALLRLRRDGGELVLDFIDNGAGFVSLNRVFDPFIRPSPSAVAPAGIERLLRNHSRTQGEISCTNRDEGGAIFTVRLPVAASVCKPSLQRLRLMAAWQSLPRLASLIP